MPKGLLYLCITISFFAISRADSINCTSAADRGGVEVSAHVVVGAEGHWATTTQIDINSKDKTRKARVASIAQQLTQQGAIDVNSINCCVNSGLRRYY